MSTIPVDHVGEAVRRTDWRRLLSLVLLCAVAVWALRHVDLLRRFVPSANHNRLSIGGGAEIEGAYPVALNSPVEFDFLSRAAVLQLRRDAVAQHPRLVPSDYRPSHAVFGQIADGLPWWGNTGQYVHGPGDRSIDGPSEESRYVLNPLLLVAVDMVGLSPWSAGFAWDGGRVSSVNMEDPDFPLYCRPKSLTWWPRESRAEVVYDLSDYLRRLNRYTTGRMTLASAYFCLMPDNARDLNLNYLAVSAETSSNTMIPEPSRRPTRILHYIHRGGSCGYPGGCNNGSPYQPEFDNLRVEALPAHVDVLLWQDEPDGPSRPPTMRFTVWFK